MGPIRARPKRTPTTRGGQKVNVNVREKLDSLNDAINVTIARLAIFMVNRWPLIKPTLINLAFVLSLNFSAVYLGGIVRTGMISIIAMIFSVYSYQRGVADTIDAVNRMHSPPKVFSHEKDSNR